MNLTHIEKAKTYNENKVVQPPFVEGDQVLFLKQKSLSSQAKLEPRWTGPMTVKKRLERASYLLTDVFGHEHTGHLDQLKIFVPEKLGESTLLEFHGPTFLSL